MKNKLMTHCVCNYPNEIEFTRIFEILSKYSEYIEVQFPFSDPIADGPIIEKANEEVLQHGFTTDDAFSLLKKVSTRSKSDSKILIMTYYNIVFNYGVKRFCEEARTIGIYGFIVPDIVFGEDGFLEFASIAKSNNIHIIPTLSPETTITRLQSIADYSSGFVYAISKNMTTGSQISFGKDLESYIINIRKYFPGREVGIGFGIKTKEDVERVSSIADFSIIGSELIKKYQSGGIDALEYFLQDITREQQ